MPKRALVSFVVAIPTIFMGMYVLQYRPVPTPTPAPSLVTTSEAIPSSTPTPVPEFIEKKVFGHSVLGRPIEGYVIGTGADTLLLFGAIHGNEMGTADLLTTLVQTVAADHSLMGASKRIVIIPIANPDGYADRIDKLNANGVNLNTNFQTTNWTDKGPEGFSAGSEPFSEIESRVIRSVVEQYQPNTMISFHSHGALVSPEEGAASIALGKWYARKSGYTYFTDWEFAGTATRWFTETSGKPAITVELSSHTRSDWNANKKALLELLRG